MLKRPSFVLLGYKYCSILPFFVILVVILDAYLWCVLVLSRYYVATVTHFLLQPQISFSNLHFTDAVEFLSCIICKQQNKYNSHNYLSSVSFAYNCCSILKDTSFEYTQIQTAETWWLHIVLKLLLLLGLHTAFPFITILLQKHEMYCCRYLLALS